MKNQAFLINDAYLIKPNSNEIFKREDDRFKLLTKVEPRLMKVLVYLIERKQTVITREELIEAIWDNIYIGEEALTQTISRLRKIFNEDRTNPQIIETITKTGYRFIADVTPLKEAEKEKPKTQEIETHRVHYMYYIFGLIAFIMIYMQSISSPTFPIKNLLETSVLTSEFGRENYPDISPLASKVVFSKRRPGDQKMNLFIIDLETRQTSQFITSNSDDLHANWSHDGKQIAYNRLIGGKSYIFMKKIANSSSDDPGKELVELNRTRETFIEWSNDNQWILYSDIGENDERISLFLINVNDGEVKHVDAKFDGDVHIARYITQNEVIFLSSDLDRSKLYRFDFESSTTERLTDLNMIVHDMEYFDDQWMLVVGEHQQKSGMYRMSLDSKILTYIGGSNIASVAVNKDHDLVIYSEQTYNIDLFQGDLRDMDKDSIMIGNATLKKIFKVDENASVYSSKDGKHNWINQDRSITPKFSSIYTETRPIYSHSSDYIVFVSNRTGIDQIWKGYFETDELKRLSDFEEGHILQVSESPDGQSILFIHKQNRTFSIQSIDENGRNREILYSGEDRLSNLTWKYDSKQIIFHVNSVSGDHFIRYDLESAMFEKIENMNDQFLNHFKDKSMLSMDVSDKEAIVSMSNPNVPESKRKIHQFYNTKESNHIIVRENGFYYKDPVSMRPDLLLSFYDFETEKISHWYSFGRDAIFSLVYFDVSPDNSEIIYSTLTNLESNLFMIKSIE